VATRYPAESICNSKKSVATSKLAAGGAYETLRMPVNVNFRLFTDMDSALLSTSFPVMSALCATDASP
jgi:hypothetical protein